MGSVARVWGWMAMVVGALLYAANIVIISDDGRTPARTGYSRPYTTRRRAKPKATRKKKISVKKKTAKKRPSWSFGKW